MPPFYTDDDYLLPPPYSLADMDVLGFWLRGKAGHMQAYLDKHVNVGGPERYILLTELLPQFAAPFAAGIDYPLLLTFHNIGKLFSTATLGAEAIEDRGFFTYKEMILWMPVFAVHAQFSALADFIDGSIPPIALVTPLILADNALAVAGGREIFGLPKRMGTIFMPTIPSQQALASAGSRLDQVLAGQGASAITDILPTYAQATRSTRQSILDVTFRARPGGGTTVANTGAALRAQVVAEASRFFDPFELLPGVAHSVKAVVESLIENVADSIGVVAHKQLRRGIVDYRQTSFSALNTMKYKLDVQEGHLITGLDITVTPHNFPNLSLTAMLGLNTEHVGFAFHARLSGELSGHAELPLNP